MTRRHWDIQAERWGWALLVIAVTYIAMRVLPVLVPAMLEAIR